MLRKLVIEGSELQRSVEIEEYEQAHIFPLYICHITCIYCDYIIRRKDYAFIENRLNVGRVRIIVLYTTLLLH
jgi:hypothetical protein